MEPPPAEALWLAIRIERRLGNQPAEAAFVSQLRSRYPTSPEYQEFLKGNFQ
jgi:type IV pilus assembly protein PilF